MSPDAVRARRRLRAFGGARCELIAVGDAADLDAAVLDIAGFERRMTRFDPSSELSRFNRSAGEWSDVSPLLQHLLSVALEAEQRSNGLVNCGCLAAVRGAGYDASIEIVRTRATPPPAALAVALPPLSTVLEVAAGRARLRPGHGVDLGGIGKGWLADLLADRFESAVINLGGDLRAVGPEGCWRVALCDGTIVAVGDAGIATSGSGGRRWNGGHHLIDPRTGAPAPAVPAALTVVAGTALEAEIIAKAAALSSDPVSAAADLGAVRVAVVAAQPELARA